MNEQENHRQSVGTAGSDASGSSGGSAGSPAGGRPGAGAGRSGGLNASGLAYILIAIGALMLAVQFGWLDWRSLVRASELWPIALVAVGVDLVTGGRRRRLVYGAALVAVIALLVGGGGMRAAVIGGDNQVVVAQELEGATSASVHLAPGVAALQLTGADRQTSLAEGTLGQRASTQVRVDYDRRGDRGTLTATTRRTGIRFPTMGGEVPWDVSLTGRVPISLSVDAGVGTALLDLRQLQIEALDIDAGVGQVTVILPATGAFRGSIDGGVGTTVVRVPKALPVRISVKTGLGRVNASSYFLRENDSYLSPSYDAASMRVDLAISAGVGEVVIETVD